MLPIALLRSRKAVAAFKGVDISALHFHRSEQLGFSVVFCKVLQVYLKIKDNLK
jgi:hypothetical protein